MRAENFTRPEVLVREDKEKNDELAIRTEAESEPRNAHASGLLRPGRRYRQAAPEARSATRMDARRGRSIHPEHRDQAAHAGPGKARRLERADDARRRATRASRSAA